MGMGSQGEREDEGGGLISKGTEGEGEGEAEGEGEGEGERERERERVRVRVRVRARVRVRVRARAWRALAVTLRRDGAEDERSLGEAVLVCCASRCGLVSRHRYRNKVKVDTS